MSELKLDDVQCYNNDENVAWWMKWEYIIRNDPFYDLDWIRFNKIRLDKTMIYFINEYFLVYFINEYFLYLYILKLKIVRTKKDLYFCAD